MSAAPEERVQYVRMDEVIITPKPTYQACSSTNESGNINSNPLPDLIPDADSESESSSNDEGGNPQYEERTAKRIKIIGPSKGKEGNVESQQPLPAMKAPKAKANAVERPLERNRMLGNQASWLLREILERDHSGAPVPAGPEKDVIHNLEQQFKESDTVLPGPFFECCFPVWKKGHFRHREGVIRFAIDLLLEALRLPSFAYDWASPPSTIYNKRHHDFVVILLNWTITRGFCLPDLTVKLKNAGPNGRQVLNFVVGRLLKDLSGLYYVQTRLAKRLRTPPPP